MNVARPGAYDPGWGNLTVTNNMPTESAWRSGVSKWCMFDYGSQMGTTYMSTGIVDYFRIPKRAYYWYRNTYAKVAPPTWPTSGTPAGLKLTASTTTLSAVDGTQDAWLLVTVVDASGKPINNNVTVTLAVTSGPGEFPTGPSITFTPGTAKPASRYRHSRRPSRHRVSDVLFRHQCHHGQFARPDLGQCDHHFPRQPGVRAWTDAARGLAAVHGPVAITRTLVCEFLCELHFESARATAEAGYAFMFEPQCPFRTHPRPPVELMQPVIVSSGALRHLGIMAALFLAPISHCGVAGAQTTTKTFINYFQPTPITCSPLSSATWGVTAVLPRDTCNGIESANGAGVPPDYYYWDGSIIRASDGTYHLFADRWPNSAGFGGWTGSDPIHAVGSVGPLGPFTYSGYVYSMASCGSDPHHGHNSMACTLLDGTYCFVVSEVVPFTIFTSSSLNGPWTPCANNPGAGLSVPAGFGGNTSYGSNVSLVVRPDGNFEIIQRHGLIALSTTGICGPYKAQQPTNTYPSSEAIPAANSASIYPNKTKHTSADPYAPASVESTYTLS